MKILKSKKGNFVDIPIAIVFILFFAIFIVLLLTMLGLFKDMWNTSTSSTDASKTFMSDSSSRMRTNYDYGIFLLAIGFIVISYMLASLIPTSRLYFVLIFFFILVVWFLSILASYLWTKIIPVSTYFAWVATDMPIMAWFMPKLLYYAIIYTIVLSIAMYAKEN
jgi:hypothetical protein